MNKLYYLSTSLFIIILPIVFTALDYYSDTRQILINCYFRWFILSAVGLRLFSAGIRQALKPAFTAKEIFRIDNPDSHPIVRELGFANICFGILAIVSAFIPEWRLASASASGLYFGLAGIMHVFKKRSTPNETFAMLTDFFNFSLLLIYVILNF